MLGIDGHSGRGCAAAAVVVAVVMVVVGAAWAVATHQGILALDAVDRKDDVLMDLLVHGQLASLAEGSRASWIVALEGLLLRVDVHVLLQVLGQSECLEANHADMLLDRAMRGDVSAQGEARGVRFVAAGDFAGVGSLHWGIKDVFELFFDWDFSSI